MLNDALAGARCSRRPTGGISTSPPRRSMRDPLSSLISSADARRRTGPPSGTFIRTSVLLLTGSPTSSLPAISRGSRSRSAPTATRAIPVRRDCPVIRFPTRRGPRRTTSRAAEPGGGVSGDRHMLVIDRDRWLLYETFATHWNAAQAQWEADSAAVFDLSRSDRRPGRLDVGGCRRAGDLSWPHALRRGVRRCRNHARVPGDDARDERAGVARVACGRHDRGRAADGCAAAAEERRRIFPASLPRCSGSSAR